MPTGIVRKPGVRAVIILFLLAADLFFMIGVIALTPPFEGFDETAHFSRIVSQAYSSQSDPASWKIDTAITNYYRQGPMPYGWITYDPLHVGDPERGYTTYREFSEQPERQQAYRDHYGLASFDPGFHPGPEPNWQYQHPGLYYFFLAPLLKLLAVHASLLTVIFVLRLVSAALALAGLGVGLWATYAYQRTYDAKGAAAVLAIGALYPFLIPEFFWEFARIGNDSLCLFLFGIAWAFLLRHLSRPQSNAWIGLGCVMGLSWLVKAFMIPASLGVLGFLAYRGLAAARRDGTSVLRALTPPLEIGLLIAAIGAPLYLIGYAHAGFVGSSELGFLLRMPNVGTIMRHALMPQGFGLGISEIVYSFWMAISWSDIIVSLPVWMTLIIVTVGAMTIASYLRLALRAPENQLLILPVWIFAPLIFGLVAHICAEMILNYGHAVQNLTPGYYLHVFSPAVVLAMAAAWVALYRHFWLRPFVWAAFFSVPLTFFVTGLYAAVFSGCAVPVQAENFRWSGIAIRGLYTLRPGEILSCADRLPAAMHDLSIIAWPNMAALSIGCAALALIAAAVLLAVDAISKPAVPVPPPRG